MRGLFGFALGLFAVSALGQSSSNLIEQSINAAYGKLQTEPNFELSMTGTEMTASSSRRFASYLYFTTATNRRTGAVTSTAVEFDTYDTSGKNPNLIFRVVGDGNNLYAYDFLNQTYSASFYSFYGKTPPVNYPGTDAVRMLNELYAVTKGPSAYMVRMLREINPGQTLQSPNYVTWAPGETSISVTDPVNDPLTSNTYALPGSYATPPNRTMLIGDAWVVYGPQTRGATRSIAFDFQDKSGKKDNSDLNLMNVYFTDMDRTRSVSWILTVTDPILTMPAGAFQPYGANALRGWKPLNSPRANQG